MTCSRCGDTGIERLDLFTSSEARPCRNHCPPARPQRRIRLPSGCVISAEEPTWLGGVFHCPAGCGKWHTRGEFMAGKEDP